uniref:Uncharacterized protein n=2 Tax=Clytia hemisphaerica TaxID=252671 RepID=A0A7M5WQJ1_9CNID
MSCRHEFPKLFLNMRHGERLGYAVYLLDHLLEENKDKCLLTHVIYDIACVLKLHLKKKNTFWKYKDFKFGIPVFHSYGHRGGCQVKNSIRRLDTFGLMDGELMERLWSYLRSFSKITKEMTPAHRTDLLSDALMHFGSKKMSGIGKYLVFLHHKATETLESCEMEIKLICSKLDVKITDDVLDSWKVEEDNAVNNRDKSSQIAEIPDWKQTYYQKLRSFHKESSLALMSEKVSDAALHQRKAKRMESTLKSLEKKHKIPERWTNSTEEFKLQQLKFLKEKSKETASTLYSRCSERLMLLVLKKRYADGSAIATRLSKQINKVCSEIKNLLVSYNSINSELSPAFKAISYIEVLNVKSPIYDDTSLISNVICPSVPCTIVKSLIQYHIRKQRAIEEVALVEQEMKETREYWENQLQKLVDYLEVQASEGIAFLLKGKINFVECFLNDLIKCFSSVTTKIVPTDVQNSQISFDNDDSFNHEESGTKDNFDDVEQFTDSTISGTDSEPGSDSELDFDLYM